MMKRIKVWIAPVLAALALGVISCTQPNQAAHSAGAQYTGYISTDDINKHGIRYDAKLVGNSNPTIHRYVDCEARTVIYSNSYGTTAVEYWSSGNGSLPPALRSKCGEQ